MSASPLTTRLLRDDRKRSALATIRAASRTKAVRLQADDGGVPGQGSKRWRTVFVDGEVLGAVTPDREHVDDDDAPSQPALRLVTRRDDALEGVRKNVRDAAGAVLAWLAAVVNHEGKTDLDAVLDRCLRPGPNVQRMNYQALADDVLRVTGVDLSAKRVQTAVAHLRLAQQQKAEAKVKPTVAGVDLGEKLEVLQSRLRANFESLLLDPSDGDAINQRRAIATEVLAAVRCAASRVIDHGFGEGIPGVVDLRSLEGRFLRFVHAQRVSHGTRHANVRDDLNRLLITLSRHDGTAEGDMKLVMYGGRVVQSLLGPDSLAGLLARLNVLVAGRALLDTELYVSQMRDIATRAEALHEDADTKSYLHWMRRLPEDQRLPSPIRLASYARSNAATRLFDRIFNGEVPPEAPISFEVDRTTPALQLACDIHDAMLARDAGFTLTLTGEFIRYVVLAHVTKDRKPLDAWLTALGPVKTLGRLESLIRFENNAILVDAAHAHATRVHPSLKRQLICVR